MEKLYKNRDWLWAQYVVWGKSSRKIAEEIGCNNVTILNWLRGFDIPVRDNGCGKSLEERFWAKVDKKGPDECWEWMAAECYGYGRIQNGKKLVRANRLSWELHNGPIPDGLCVLHRCDNPSCVNPGHLKLGTDQDNADDMTAKDRQAKGEDNGWAKLAKEEALEICELLAAGKLPQREIAEMYGVDQTAISKINTGTTWAWLKEKQAKVAI